MNIIAIAKICLIDVVSLIGIGANEHGAKEMVEETLIRLSEDVVWSSMLHQYFVSTSIQCVITGSEKAEKIEHFSHR